MQFPQHSTIYLIHLLPHHSRVLSIMSHPLASLLRVSSFSVTETSSLVPLITQQESLARFTSFTYETAWQLGSTIRSIFLEQHAAKVLSGESGIVVRIELWNGLEVFSCVVGDGPVVGPSNWWVVMRSGWLMVMMGEGSGCERNRTW